MHGFITFAALQLFRPSSAVLGRETNEPYNIHTIVNATRMSAQCHLVFAGQTIPGKKWGGPPSPRGPPWTRSFASQNQPHVIPERPARGPAADQGVRPTIYAERPIQGKLSGIAHECVRHVFGQSRCCARVVDRGY